MWKEILTVKNFNIADWFSFYRLIAAPFLLLLIGFDLRLTFSIFLLISYLTDAIDGFLARRLKITSARGSQLDSLGDQITLLVGIVGLYFFEQSFIYDYLLFIALAFVPYLIQMLLAFIKYGKATAFHTYLAKFSAIIQSIFILHALFFHPQIQLFYFMVIIGILETVEEITLIFLYPNWVADVKSIFTVRNDARRSTDHDK